MKPELEARLSGLADSKWEALLHAYGPATDTPGHLAALLGEDVGAFGEALSHLGAAVLHQGTIYPVTPVVVRFVVGILAAPVLRSLDRDEDLRLVDLLQFLEEAGASAGYAVERLPKPRAMVEVDPARVAAYLAELAEDEEAWDEELFDQLLINSSIELIELASEVSAELAPFTEDADDAVREAAIDAAARWAQLPANAAARGGEVVRLRDALTKATKRDERARLVLALGDLGADLTGLLRDEDPAIRACAALSVKSVAGTAELIAALSEPRASDTWFAKRPARFHAWPRYSLLAELLARELRFEEILPVALVIAPITKAMSADFDWGPLLKAAFPGVVFTPGVRPDPPTRLTGAQRAYLDALVANEKLWDPRSGNASLARMQVGLPDQRDEVARLVRDLPDAAN